MIAAEYDSLDEISLKISPDRNHNKFVLSERTVNNFECSTTTHLYPFINALELNNTVDRH